jgi:pimeloyl-ACP methyl ester carboxylesterase
MNQGLLDADASLGDTRAMPRIALRCLVLLGLLGSACGTESAPKSDGEAKPTSPSSAEFDHAAEAQQIIEWIEKGEHAKVRELFDEAMTAALPSDLALAGMWSAIEAQFGQFDRPLATTVEKQDPYTIVLVTCSFATSPMDVRVVFDQANRLAGLQVTPTQNPAAYGERPQTPKPPFPYATKEVLYPNAAGSIEIGGTLTIPEGAGPHPVVLLITGSGSQDRDETLFGHKPFAVVADHLTRKGIAVLRVDDRGVGKTTGDPTTATVEDHVTDVEAGVAFLKTQPEIDPTRIGLIGHSEGGVIAPIVAAKSSDVAFLISLAGPAVSGAELNPMQVRALLEAGNAPAAIVDEIVAGQENLMKLLVAGAPDQELQDAVKALAKVAVKLTPGVDPNDEEAQKATAREMVPLLSPWFRSWAKLDPAPHLASVKVPILIMIGEKDLQVPAAENLEKAKAALAGNPELRAEQLPGLNHLFQTAKTGTMDEYVTITETFNPAALELMTQWLLEVTAKPPSPG